MRCDGNCSDRLWASRLAGGGPPPSEKQFFILSLTQHAESHPPSVGTQSMTQGFAASRMVFSNAMLSPRRNVVI